MRFGEFPDLYKSLHINREHFRQQPLTAITGSQRLTPLLIQTRESGSALMRRVSLAELAASSHFVQG